MRMTDGCPNSLNSKDTTYIFWIMEQTQKMVHRCECLFNAEFRVLNAIFAFYVTNSLCSLYINNVSMDTML